MKILVITTLDPRVRSVSSVHKFIVAAKALGHDIAVYGHPNPELPAIPFTMDLAGVELAVFAIQVTSDFPDMPYLARVLDTVPRERRVLLDLWGKVNDTIRLDHDFNHLEKLDGHLGWEWVEAMQAVSGTILQPALKPLRSNVRPYLFHGYDPASVAKPYANAREAAAAWQAGQKPYGVLYAGSNWQRWDQIRPFLQGYGAARNDIGPACLVGWDWGARPEWAAQMGIMGIDTDPALLAQLGVQVRDAVRFDEVIVLLGKARFAPVIHRPLFRHLGFVTNRTFETFCADTIPVLMLPRDFVSQVYGEAALILVPGDDIAAHLRDAMRRPEHYWDAVLQTRSHLERHHSYKQRVQELLALATNPARAGAAS
jgi:hypothetical protein